jgi:hypothetical protein
MAGQQVGQKRQVGELQLIRASMNSGYSFSDQGRRNSPQSGRPFSCDRYNLVESGGCGYRVFGLTLLKPQIDMLHQVICQLPCATGGGMIHPE